MKRYCFAIVLWSVENRYRRTKLEPWSACAPAAGSESDVYAPEGEVVADHPYPHYPAFVEALGAIEGYPGEAVPGGGTSAERALMPALSPPR